MRAVSANSFERPRFADARLAHEHHEPADPRPYLAQPRRQPCQLDGPAHERRVRQQRRRLILLIQDFTRRGRRLRAPLSRQQSAVTKVTSCWPVSRLGTSALQRDLAGERVSAETTRDDYRSAEVVALVAQCVADVQSDPDRQPLSGGAAARFLLHRHRAAYGIHAGEANTVIKPSPNHFTSCPPWVAAQRLSSR